MTWMLLDLVRQVKHQLRLLNGGSGNRNGWGRGELFAGWNGTGGTLAVGTLVRYAGEANYVESSTTDGERILGVVAGYLAPNGELVEEDAPDGGTCAVLVGGVTSVTVDATVARGDYAFAADTDGQARGAAAPGPACFGLFIEDATAGYPALVWLNGTGGVAPAALAHTDLTGVTADQHHTEVHDSDGATHNFPGGTSTFLRADGQYATPSAGSGGAGGYSWYGDGSDGDFDLDGVNTYGTQFGKSGNTYTLLRDLYADNLTIQSGVTMLPDRFFVYVMDNLINEGTIRSDGASAAGQAGGLLGSANRSVSGNGVGAGAGVNGRANSAGVGANGGSLTTTGAGGNGGNGGSATSGGGNGGTTGIAPATGGFRALPMAALSRSANWTYLLGGAGGGAGGSASSTTTSSGGSGSGGFWQVICAAIIDNSGTISANGGDGGDASGTGAAGGGGGGGGGVLVLVHDALTNTGTISADGGVGGSGVNGGNNGSDGDPGVVLLLPMA